MSWATNIALRSVAEVALGRQRSPQHADGPFMVKYLRAANVKDGKLDLADVQSMNFSPAEQAIYSLRRGDVLITEGSGSIASVGASAAWRGEIPGTVCFQNTLLRLRPRPMVTDGSFLEWWARSAFGSGIFASLAGGANIHHISAERVRSLRINLPTIQEQQSIARFLRFEVDRIDRMTDLKARILNKVGERISAAVDILLDDMIRRGGSLPLRRHLLAVDQGSSPQCDSVPAGEDEWGVLKVSCLRPGLFNPSENKRLPSSIPAETRYEVRQGDVLIARANTPYLVGSTAVVKAERRKILLSDKIFRIRLSPTLDPEFFAITASGSRIRLMCAAVSNGASQSMANIRFDEIKMWPIPSASISDQRAAVATINDNRVQVDRLTSKIDRQLELLAERRQELITAAVTGQIDVSTASGRGIED